MIKRVVILICLFSLSSWADRQKTPNNEADHQKDDEKIIGGIGGTGLHDMERPEWLERPDIDLNDIRDDSSDGLETIDAPDVDLDDMTPNSP